MQTYITYYYAIRLKSFLLSINTPCAYIMCDTNIKIQMIPECITNVAQPFLNLKVYYNSNLHM